MHTASPVKATDESAKSFPRTVTRSLKVHETSEGVGLRIRRFIGNRTVRCLPPFVICEQFKMDETGRPPHPARGAQKITFVLSGKIRVDYSESSVELGPGDVTSLMVGRGVIRSIRAVPDEENEKQGSTKSSKASASGMQIFMDVPEPFKRMDHSHINLCHTDIVTCEPSDGCNVRILTGSAFGKKADQMLTATPALILDCELKPGATIDIPVKLDWNAFAYVIDGKVSIQGEKTQKSQYVEFMRSTKSTSTYSYKDSSSSAPSPASSRSSSKSSSDSPSEASDSADEAEEGQEAYVTIAVDATASHNARVLFSAAKPLCQPIYRQGPFVDVSMNWIHQAFDDYTAHKNGFESNAWKGRTLVPNTIKPTSSSTVSASDYTKSDPQKPVRAGPSSSLSKAGSSQQEKRPRPDERDEEDIQNPCEQQSCDSEGNIQDNDKASNPNVFPPGVVNPASYSTTFNGVEGVEEQQEQMLPRKPSPPSGKRRPPFDNGDNDASSDPTFRSPSPKRRNTEH